MRIWLAIFTMLLPIAAEAQLPKFVEVVVPITAQEAFATPYGRIMADEFAAALRTSADQACLAERRMGPDQLRQRGEEILVRHGQARLDRTMAFINPERADAEFVRIGGPSAQDQWRATLADPVVAEYSRLQRPAKLAAAVDGTVENVDRYVLLSRIKLDSFGPLSTGRTRLLNERARATGESLRAAEAFAARNQTAALRRYTEMSRWVEQAIDAALDRDRAMRLGPRDWMPGLDADLRTICILPK